MPRVSKDQLDERLADLARGLAAKSPSAMLQQPRDRHLTRVSGSFRLFETFACLACLTVTSRELAPELNSGLAAAEW